MRNFLAALLLLFTTEICCEQNEIEARKKSVTSKVNLLGRLVQNSPMANRIMQSDNEGAKDLLNEASAEWQVATQELELMNITQAEESVKRGLILMTQASSSVADKVRITNAQKARYQQLRERIFSFTAAFQRIALEKKQKDISWLLDNKKIDALLGQAEQLAMQGSYHEANQHLSFAADSVEIALAQARHKETLLHDLTFESPAEEYEYEKQRNHSYMLLADLIRTKKKIEPNSLQRFHSILKENEILREQADELAGSGDIEAAIKMLEQGTLKLARTLRASGVVF